MSRIETRLALYDQVKNKIREKIEIGEWLEGQKIPSEKELCEMFNVSRITARKAVNDLQEENLLIKKQGKGTFVKKSQIDQSLQKFYSFSKELAKQGIEEKAEMLEFKITEPNYRIKRIMNISSDEEVFVIKRLRLLDGKPYAIEISYIPVKYTPELTMELVDKNGLYNSLQAFGVKLERATEKFSAVNLRKEEAYYLNSDLNKAAIRLTRRTYHGDNMVEYCSSIVRGDVFTYTVDLF